MTGWEIIRRVAARWNRDDAGMLTASVAYYAAISLFPLLMILTSSLGLFVRWTDAGQEAHNYVLSAISDQISPELRQNVELALDQVAENAGWGGPIGFLMLLCTALAIFSQFDRAFSRIWQDAAPLPMSLRHSVVAMLTHRLRAFALLVGLGVAIIAVFFSEIAFDTFRSQTQARLTHTIWFWWVLETSLGILLNAIAFSVLYRMFPRCRVSWSLAFRGGLFASGIWEVGRQLLAVFVIGQRYTSAYGVIGALMAIMLWGYYSIAVVFVGAEYIQVLREYGSQRAASAPNPLAPGPTSRRVLDLMFALCILYVGSFLVLREMRSYQLPQFTESDPRHRVVVFSPQPDAHRVTLSFYAPLIEVFPGKRYYPDAIEMQQLLRDAWATRDSRKSILRQR